MKRLLILILILSLFPLNAFSLNLSAKSAIVMDAQTGMVLYELNAYEKRSMASTTKIMTAIVALENSSPDAVVTVSAHAAATEGSSIYLTAGEKIRMEDLVYGLMLNSGNDAAVAIAEHISGSVDNFAKLMNDKALAIGACNTSFKNPSGLDADGHYTTAYDLALITRYALSNPVFKVIVSTKIKSIPWEGHEWNRQLKNHNKMLSLYDGADGVKTGYTKKTGRTLVSSATRDGWQVIAVTLNDPNDWSDHEAMLDYAFSNFPKNTIVQEGGFVSNLPVKDGVVEQTTAIAAREFVSRGKDIKLDFILPEQLQAPVLKGQKLGEIKIHYKDVLLDTIDIVAKDECQKFIPPKTFYRNLKMFLSELIKLMQ